MDQELSLHCSICLESFNLEERAPVVLPCGHTFICMECSQKLDKCMTCRTPLYLLTDGPTQKEEENNLSYRYQPRYQPRGYLSPQQRRTRQYLSPEQVVPPPKKVRLPIPIPKNEVLMKILETSQKTATVEEKRQIDYTNERKKEEEDLREGIRNFAGSYGTYVVREDDGLSIQRHSSYDDMELYDEDRQEFGSSEETIRLKNTPFDESDEDDNVNTFSMNCDEDENVTDNIPPKARLESHFLQQQRDKSIFIDEDSDESRPKMKRLSLSKIPTRLKYGQTVQISNFEDGIAKLARSAGYVRANPKQLIKIGCARDESCEIEGQLSLLSQRRRALYQELDSMDEKILKLEKMLVEARTVPYADAFAMLQTEEASEELNVSSEESSKESKQRQDTFPPKDLEMPDLDQAPETPKLEGRPELNKDLSDFTSPNLTNTYDSDDENDENYNDENDISSYTSFLCSPGSFGFSDSNTAAAAVRTMSESIPITAAVATAAPNNTATTNGTPNSSPVVTPGSESIRRRNPYQPSSPYQKLSGVDFRSGLSCHSALTTSNSASRNHYNVHFSPGRREIKSRGEHRGIGSIKVKPHSNRKNNHPNSPSSISNILGFL